MKLMKLQASNKGFTLIEIIVATMVSTLLLIGILTFLTATLVNNSVRQARADLLREAQLALDTITRETRLSANVDETNRIEDPNSPNAEEQDGLGWVSDSDTLVLATAVEDNNRNIIFQDATHYITEKNNNIFYLDNGNLYRRRIAADIDGNSEKTSCPPDAATGGCPADVRLVQNVNSFEINYYNAMDEEVDPSEARSIELTLSLRAVKYGREVNVQYNTRTVFRNE